MWRTAPSQDMFCIEGKEKWMIGEREGDNAGKAGKITVVFPRMNLESNSALFLKWFL